MRPEALADARKWLSYADEDLASCRVLLQSPRARLGAASYHAQQAAEKALKAFLVAREEPLMRTHDVGVLVARCESIDDSFAPFSAAAARLTPYAVMHRYPGASDYPEIADVEQALADANGILEFVRTTLVANCDG
jgi:HEPN domain-containing protein